MKMASAVQFVVLITDLSTRKAFDLANIFRSKNITTILCDAAQGIEKRMLSRAYGGSVEVLRKDENFTHDMEAILQKYRDQKVVYIPIEEDTTLLVYRFLKEKRFDNFYHNLPPENAFDTVRDKAKFATFCHQENIPVPEAYSCEVLLEMKQLPFPLIVKPKSGSGSVGILFIDTKEELVEVCAQKRMDAYIIQRRLENPADVQGAFFLFEAGKMVGYYGHKRIRTYPVTGGVTIYSRCDLDPRLEALGEELLERLNWSGLAMVEFLYDPSDDAYKIIEVNPRLWGSLMLAEFCGSQMLENYCLSALHRPLKEAHIEKERYIRWFFPWEILVYLQRRGDIEKFWRFERDVTCYINFTYTTPLRSFLFTLYNMANPKKLKRLFQKVTAA